MNHYYQSSSSFVQVEFFVVTKSRSKRKCCLENVLELHLLSFSDYCLVFQAKTLLLQILQSPTR